MGVGGTLFAASIGAYGFGWSLFSLVGATHGASFFETVKCEKTVKWVGLEIRAPSVRSDLQ